MSIHAIRIRFTGANGSSKKVDSASAVQDGEVKEVTGEPGWKQLLNDHEKLISLAYLEDRTLVESFLGKERFRTDMSLWNALLSTRIRLHGPFALVPILKEMAERKVLLPVVGEEADFFWHTVIEAAIQKDLLSEVLYKYLQETLQKRGQLWEPLYATVLSRALASDTKSAIFWHERLQDLGLATEGNFKTVVRNAVNASDRATLRRLGYIYRTIKPGTYHIHDFIIPKIKGSKKSVYRWQTLLVSMKDLPADLSSLPLELQKRAEEILRHRPIDETTTENETFGPNRDLSLDDDMKDLTDHLRRQRKLACESIRGLEPDGISDDTAARAFATTLFSVEAIIRALTGLGLQVLGPVGLRQLCLRCDGPQDVWQKMALLQERNVSFYPCVYSKFIYFLAKRGRGDILKSTLECDLHPDTFGDADTQKQLLREYLSRQDMDQAYRTLVLITLFYPEKIGSIWNAMLHHELDKGPARIKAIVDDMLSNNIRITSNSIKNIFLNVARIRRQTRFPDYWTNQLTQPQEGSYDDLRFLTRLFMDVTRQGTMVPPDVWQGLLKFYAMDGRLMEMEKLAMWLAVRFPPRSSLVHRKTFFHAKSRSTITRKPHEGIFNASLQKAIIEWGFKTIGHWMPWKQLTLGFRSAVLAEGNNEWRHDEVAVLRWWDRGLLLCRELQRLGFRVDPRMVESICIKRLRTLFGEKRSEKLENVQSRDRNLLTIREIVARANEIFDKQVFRGVLHLPDEQLAERLFARDAEETMRGSERQRRFAKMLLDATEFEGRILDLYGNFGGRPQAQHVFEQIKVRLERLEAAHRTRSSWSPSRPLPKVAHEATDGEQRQLLANG